MIRVNSLNLLTKKNSKYATYWSIITFICDPLFLTIAVSLGFISYNCGILSQFLKGVVQADFAFFDPKPDDFHGVKVLLKTYLDDKQWDLSGFVDLILGQTTVGTVIKIEEDEDDGVYAVATALNLGRYKASSIYLFNTQLLAQ